MNPDADDVVLIPPMVGKILGRVAGEVRGKTQLREYSAKGLAAFPDPRFDLQAVLSGAAGLTLPYPGGRGTGGVKSRS